MKCHNCGGEWMPPAGKSLTVCPFCQTSLVKTEAPKSFDTIREVLVYIADNAFTVSGKEINGLDILLSEKIVSFFSDIAPALKDEKELIKIIRDKGALDVLKSAINMSQTEREIALKRAAGRLPAFMDKEAIASVLNDFARALGWDNKTHFNTITHENGNNDVPVLNVSDEHRKVLALIFDIYAKYITSFLTGYLRTESQVAVMSVGQAIVGEYKNGLSNPAIIACADVNPLGKMIVDMSPQVGYAFIDRILGGHGQKKKLRDFSDVEKILLERIFSQLLTVMSSAWENILAVITQLERVETQHQLAWFPPLAESVCVVEMSIGIGDIRGGVNFLFPLDTLRNVDSQVINNNIDAAAWVETRESPIANAVELGFVVELGRGYAKSADMIALSQGDVLILDRLAGERVDIIVDGRCIAKGEIGLVDDTFSVKIAEFQKQSKNESDCINEKQMRMDSASRDNRYGMSVL